VRKLLPLQPLRNTLVRLAKLEAETVLIQFIDRASQHLYPKLTCHRYEFETTQMDEVVATVIWRPS